MSLIGVLFLATGCASPQPLMAVRVPLVDVRAKPHTSAQPDAHDPLQETQLLYGERVRLLRVEEGWAHIEAIEQPEFSHAHRWQGYPGWIPASTLAPSEALASPTIVVSEKWASTWRDPHATRRGPWGFPLGTWLRGVDMGGQLWQLELLDGTTTWMDHRNAQALDQLQALSPKEKRRAVLRSAGLLMGDAYYWGGRSPRRKSAGGPTSGVDCSGLVNLAYRTIGMIIPRDAHEQFLRAQPVKVPQPADLIFLSERGNPDHVVHVMLYAGEGEVIEGPGTGLSVRRIGLAERLGQPLDWLAPGTVVQEQTVSYGSYLP